MAQAGDFVATGGCLCGAVRFGLKEKLSPVGFCHCSLCRRASGVGVCGKEGQSVPVGVGQPTLRIDRLTVGGTA